MVAVEFSKTQSKSSRYVCSKIKGVVDARAVTNLDHPDLKESVVPMCVMKTKTEEVDGKEVVTKFDVPMISAQIYGGMYEKYMIQYKAWFAKTKTWAEMNANIFNLVLQHCPKVL